MRKVNNRMTASSQSLPTPAGKKLTARDAVLLRTRPEVHHHIAESVKEYDYITPWLTENLGDPALKEFLPRLRDHLLARLLNRIWDGDEHNFTDAERRQVLFDNDRLYRHNTVRINYTTYDLRRAQDSINTHSHADIMLLSHEDDGGATPPHPYWYARVIGIYHVFVTHPTLSPEPRRLDFLWVRWFGRDTGSPSGWAARRLHRVGFVDSADPSAFGFVNPQDVVRGVHMIPAFAYGRTSELLAHSIARKHEENKPDGNDDEEDPEWIYHNEYDERCEDTDYLFYYVGMYVLLI